MSSASCPDLPAAALAADPDTGAASRPPGVFWAPASSLALVVALALAATACGPEGAPPRLAVVGRDPTWIVARAGAAPARFGRAWRFMQPDSTWSPLGATSVRRAPGELRVSHAGRALLQGPHDVAVDPDLHHRFVITTETRGVASVRLQWRGIDGGFDEFRTHVWTVDGDSEQIHSVRLTRLRGLTAQPAGAPAFRIAFVPAENDGAVAAVVRSIELVSDFDPPPDLTDPPDRRAPRWWTRAGLARRGVLLRPAETLACQLPTAPGDVLRLSLASVGTDKRLHLGISARNAAGEAIHEQLLSVTPEASWAELCLTLPDGLPTPATWELSLGDAAPAGAVILVGGVLHLSPDSSPRPDIVLYVEDTLRADRLTTYGYEHATDPHLAAIAADGIVFEHAIAASNWTRPAITTMLTSLDPLAHGNRSRRTRLGDDPVTLAQALASAGYVTAAFVTNWHAGSWSGLDRGFDFASEPVAFGAVGVTSTLTSSLVADPVEAFLEEHAGERVFVYVHSLDPHHPYQPPERDLSPLRATATSRKAVNGTPEQIEHSLLYDAEVRHNDGQLARLDDALRRRGRLADTLFVFSSDHGEGFGEHGHFQHRKALFQEELGVPWVLRWPSSLAPARLTGTVGHLDLAPTVLGLAGLVPPPGWQGRDLSTWIVDGELPEAAAVPLLAEVALPPARAEGHAGQLAVVLQPYKLIAAWAEDGTLSPRALYDLEHDPGEQRNLLDDGSRAAVLARLVAWARTQVAASRARADPAHAEHLDPETKAWMEAMGYLK